MAATPCHHVKTALGRARSDITHMIMCMDSGVNEMKSQNVSCAEAACGISCYGSGLTAWILFQVIYLGVMCFLSALIFAFTHGISFF